MIGCQFILGYFYLRFFHDALDDLFRDFCWIENDNIVIIHEGIAGLSKKDLNLYVASVVNCIEFWICQSTLDNERKVGNNTEWEASLHHVWFIFPEKEKEVIMDIYSRQPVGEVDTRRAGGVGGV